VSVLLPAALPDADRVADAIAAQLREAGRRVTVLDGAEETEETTSALVVRLLSEVLRNGGAIVTAGIDGTAELGARLAATGFVVEVGLDGEPGSLREGGVAPGSRFTRLLVPADGTPELLAGLVGDHLRRAGFLPAEPAHPSLGDHVGSRSV
jgi:hypothetical protein